MLFLRVLVHASCPWVCWAPRKLSVSVWVRQEQAGDSMPYAAARVWTVSAPIPD